MRQPLLADYKPIDLELPNIVVKPKSKASVSDEEHS